MVLWIYRRKLHDLENYFDCQNPHHHYTTTIECFFLNKIYCGAPSGNLIFFIYQPWEGGLKVAIDPLYFDVGNLPHPTVLGEFAILTTQTQTQTQTQAPFTISPVFL